MNKIFAIGDIHGCLDKLQRLIQDIAADPANDTLVFIGDYIDRADGGRDVVDYVLELEKVYQKVICLCGNHESMLMRYLEGVDEEMYLVNGGLLTLEAYGISRTDTLFQRKAKIPSAHLRFFESLLPYYETDQFIFVHAGLLPGMPLAGQAIHDLLWIRRSFIDSDYDFGKRVIFGHTHFNAPLVAANKIGIDTGAVFGGKLTCVELPTLKFYQV
ncbi:MAG: serine/threonine protein phosphatase [Deltaproteobacteria bacterium HGW-Deltaproteobacteria-7]|jgi:serine/threonine protein phosphatase 1|nr:MAG: serine/threonine protein phosphatase [Deltaproteobacteria bacterium HGW-Deltaproteobacteria-7]PKN18048.1 MAG: serine/threonine protein phosphatase [Deltaproteobacteria bacterium HGW-Deltaproteobacteria-6]